MAKLQTINDSRQVARYKKCTKIVLGKCGGWDAALHKRGIPLFYTDIDRIYHLMEEKLKAGN